jgi:hypothetical protein
MAVRGAFRPTLPVLLRLRPVTEKSGPSADGLQAPDWGAGRLGLRLGTLSPRFGRLADLGLMICLLDTLCCVV